MKKYRVTIIGNGGNIYRFDVEGWPNYSTDYISDPCGNYGYVTKIEIVPECN